MASSLYYIEATRKGEEIEVSERGLPGWFFYREEKRIIFRDRTNRILNGSPESDRARYFPFSNKYNLSSRERKYVESPLLMKYR